MRHATFPQVMQQLYSSCNSYTRHVIAILNSYSRHTTAILVIQQLYASYNSYTRHTTAIRVIQQCRTRFTLCVLTVSVSMAGQQKEMSTRWSQTLQLS